MAGVNLSHAGRHAGHALLRHQEEQSLGRFQGDLIPERKKEADVNERLRFLSTKGERV